MRWEVVLCFSQQVPRWQVVRGSVGIFQGVLSYRSCHSPKSYQSFYPPKLSGECVRPNSSGDNFPRGLGDRTFTKEHQGRAVPPQFSMATVQSHLERDAALLRDTINFFGSQRPRCDRPHFFNLILFLFFIFRFLHLFLQFFSFMFYSPPKLWS